MKNRLPDSTIPTTARPGGAQTRVKLGVLDGYIQHFAKASSSAIDRVYIDGLAGSGDGIDKATGETYDGSAKRCFSVEPPFTRCLLIEQNPARAAKLKDLEQIHENAEVYQGDVNIEIPRLLKTVNRRAATFAFLDPEGSELHWATIEKLAAHKRGFSKWKIELLILFPLQMCVLRLLDFKNGRLPDTHARRLDAMLGSESPWREIRIRRLTGEINTAEETRAAFLDAYSHGLHHDLGYKHVLAREVHHESGRPLFYLVFASDHDAGKRIMKHEFGASHSAQDQLFNLADFTPGMVYDSEKERPYRL